MALLRAELLWQVRCRFVSPEIIGLFDVDPRSPVGTHDPSWLWYTTVSRKGVRRMAIEDGAARSLDRVALAMTSTLDLDAVLSCVTSGLADDFGVALARVWLAEPREPILRLRASSGLSVRTDGEHARVPIGAKKIGHIAATREAMWTNDVVHDERIADHAWAARHGLVSFAGWPLTFRGRLQGVLATFATRPLGDAERARMALFAHQAAIAIENARLFSAVAALEARLRAENAYLRHEVAGGEETAAAGLARCEDLAGVVGQIAQVAAAPTTVLVQGETGTGKELVARAIHDRGPRAPGPLVKVNCAALSPSLVESELFGHEKGAFTGAQQRRVGRFELADGGTLFLDEVGELPLELQPKLLRVLQEQEFERVGGSRSIRVDVRVVAATNRDLSAAVQAGRFRADLFYRLAVFVISVPPLRERPRDCVLLADAFVRSQRHRLGKELTGLTSGALQRLLAHDWPGNVRELSNVIERAAIVAHGPVIGETDLPPLARADAPRTAIAGASEPAAGVGDARMESVERSHIVHVLERTGWVVEGRKGAASILGMAPSTLRSRMAGLGIRRLR
jgi:transcriptional regulator with GAF, ATPase, and Fis domain